MTDHDPAKQPPQHDKIEPMMREGRSGTGWIWIVSGAILVAIVVTFFAVNANHDNTAQNRQPDAAPPITTGAGSTPPQPAQPAGRTTGHAPPSGGQTTVR